MVNITKNQLKNITHKDTFKGFEPLVFDDSQILILGSFPSVKSRENNFYYGNPQNRFWKMLVSIFEEKVPKSIDEKIKLCKKHKIALWDVVIRANLQGSSDISLKKSDYIVDDIENLLRTHPAIKTILCNGKLAFNLFMKNFNVGIPVYYMPSTSPANVRFDIDKWMKYLKP